MKINRLSKVALVGIFALGVVGCASIVDGRNKKVSIKSQPPGATATIYNHDGVLVASNQTPVIVPLERSVGYFQPTKYRIVLELPGYKTAEVEVKSTISGWYWGNILFGGLIGMLIVDPATGAMWTLSPKEIDQALTAGTAGVVREEGGLVVMLLKDLPQELAGGLRPLGAKE